MDLMELWGLARRHWLTLAISTLSGLALAAGISLAQPELYSATSTGYVVAGNSATVGDAFAGKNLAAEKATTYLPLVQSRSVAERVAEDLGLDSIGAVSGALEGRVVGTVIFEITATASTPELARDLADAAIRQTSAEANALETLTVSGETTGQTVIRIVPVELARTPSTPVSPNTTRNLALGVMLGLMTGFGIVVLRHSLDRRIRRAADVEEITGTSALGVVPKAAELAERVSPVQDGGAAAEALRQLRTNLRYVSVDKPPRSIVVTSSNAGEGKSTVASHLASLVAASGQPTVLVDADLRRPTLAKRFDVGGAVGLSEVIAGSAEIADALLATDQPDLFLIPAGRVPPNPAELVGSGRMQSIIATLTSSYIVIIDAPPLLAVTDAGLLTRASDGALLVVQSGATRKEQVALSAKTLEQVAGTLLGVVLNMVPRNELGLAVYGYGYGNYAAQYYYGEDRSPKGLASRLFGALRRSRRGGGRRVAGGDGSAPGPRAEAAEAPSSAGGSDAGGRVRGAAADADETAPDFDPSDVRFPPVR